MLGQTARVVAQSYGQSRPTQHPARFNQPFGPGIFPPGSEAIASTVRLGTLFGNRLCPDEKLLRQNGSI